MGEAEKARVLIVAEEPLVLDTLSRHLAQAGFDVHIAPTAGLALTRIAGGDYAAILCDVAGRVPAQPPVLRELQRRHPHLADRLVFFAGNVLALSGKREREGKRPPLRVARRVELAEILWAVQQAANGTRPGSAPDRPRVQTLSARRPWPRAG